QKTMGWKYQFDGTYRIPNDVDAKRIGVGTDAVIEDLIKNGGAKVFNNQTRAHEILTNDSLRYWSMWITNRDETGLELRLRGKDGDVYAVQGPDGTPVVRSWADLMTRARAAKVVDDTGEGTTEWMRRRQEELNPRR
ncbi:MAG TPA: hypothetical protein VIN03_16110, partial [Roseateles sp.]